MSTVVAWAAKDTNGITSMYFISESRISWGKNAIWDHGQKVFSLNRCGIIAYCGDVLYPTQTISQIKDLIDKEILFKISDTNNQKISIIRKYLQNSLQNYPKQINNTIILVALVLDQEFDYYELTLNNNDVALEHIELKANEPYSYGSGSQKFKSVFTRLKEEKFSRYICQAFFRTIEEGKDPLSGGPIQLVGIYRNSDAKTFGIVQDDKKYIYGQKIDSNAIPLDIEWRNRNFEIIDASTMKRKEKAQRQPFHKKL
ncbi:hypothetical protein N5915_02600 [Arcobacter lacus]|uniref:hypothetical protein n=1 Tax=Arcobacter lacus TaxID=1912876 RepID=UPI0021BBA7C2|nr:hypothetical protein [Arcobacter lacus]MCT7908440.1 hypothetical protein [Arcobacter lacus]